MALAEGFATTREPLCPTIMLPLAPYDIIIENNYYQPGLNVAMRGACFVCGVRASRAVPAIYKTRFTKRKQ